MLRYGSLSKALAWDHSILVPTALKTQLKLETNFLPLLVLTRQGASTGENQYW